MEEGIEALQYKGGPRKVDMSSALRSGPLAKDKNLAMSSHKVLDTLASDH